MWQYLKQKAGNAYSGGLNYLKQNSGSILKGVGGLLQQNNNNLGSTWEALKGKAGQWAGDYIKDSTKNIQGLGKSLQGAYKSGDMLENFPSKDKFRNAYSEGMGIMK